MKKYGNISLKKLTSYKLEGITKQLIYPENIDELKEIIIDLKNENLKYKVIGGGSNLIFNGNYNGVLIKLDYFNKIEFDDTNIVVGAGYSLQKLAIKSCKLGLSGLEFATGIPGTIGGACFNNSGAYNSDMGYIVTYVKVLTPNLEIKTLYNKDLDYHYRTSFFKKNPGYIILEAKLKLKKGNKKEIFEIVSDRRKRRLESQPLDYPSAGSVFRNPEGNYAGKLIEDIGFKGKREGGAKVSTKHANFIINTGRAKGSDIIKLINKIQNKVKEEYGIDLILEQEIVE